MAELDPKTVKALKRFFENEVCDVCGSPAVRFVRKGFKCEKHYLSRKDARTRTRYTIKEVKAPRFKK